MVYSAGMLNVAQPGFMAIGGYSAALALTRGFPLWQGLLIGFIVIAIVAYILAHVTARLTGVYLAVATMAFMLIVQQLIVINPSIGGAVGIHGIPMLLNPWSGFLILAGVSLFAYGIMKSRLGYEMRIVREDEVAARSVGIDVRAVRIQTCLLSAWVAGIAGTMNATHSSFIGPDDFGFSTLIRILSFAIVGGTDRWWGAVLGAAFLTYLAEGTRIFQAWREVLSGAIILGVVLLFPEGIVGGVFRLQRILVRRQKRTEMATPIPAPGIRRGR